MPLHRFLAALALLALPLPLPLAPLAAQRATPDSGAASSTATIFGTVYDSVARRPLAGAVVQLVPVERRGSAFSATTDADGLFRITGVPRERYLIGFLHPVTDSLGLGAPTRAVDVRGDSAVSVTLALPSATTIRAQLCGRSDPKDSTGLVLGFVRDADSGMPLDGSTVVVMWGELVVDKNGVRQERRQLPGKTSPEGWFALCGLPTDAALAARAERGTRASGYIELQVPPHGLLHQDFALPTDSAALVVADTGAARTGEPRRRGTAQLTGVVRGPNGKPFAGAQVFVWGSASSAQTADDGSFTLAALPAGTQTLEARVVGFLPQRVTVDLASGRTTNVTVTLAERVNTLDAVTIYGQQSRRTRDLNGFLQRSKTGVGRFITADEIERRDPLQFTDLLFTTPGVRVMQSGPFSRTIVMREGCPPTVYLDGVKLITAEDLDYLVNPRDIIGVEIYQVSTIPPQFNSMSGCGSIVIWTGFRQQKK